MSGYNIKLSHFLLIFTLFIKFTSADHNGFRGTHRNNDNNMSSGNSSTVTNDTIVPGNRNSSGINFNSNSTSSGSNVTIIPSNNTDPNITNSSNGTNSLNTDQNPLELVWKESSLFTADPSTRKYFENVKLPNVDTSSTLRTGKATHYGPWNSSAQFSEPGYQPNDTGVACSTGEPGGDPKWKELLSYGLLEPNRQYPQNKMTIWPRIPTVAVSEAVFGDDRKKATCWSVLQIRNKKTLKFVHAVVVDFCPKKGCNWRYNDQTGERLGNNVDIYGENTWKLLGGGSDDGVMEIEVLWPSHLSSSIQNVPFSSITSSLLLISVFMMNISF